MDARKVVFFGFIFVGIGLWIFSKDDNPFSNFRQKSSFRFSAENLAPMRGVASTPSRSVEAQKKDRIESRAQSAPLNGKGQRNLKTNDEVISYKQRAKDNLSQRRPDFLSESGSSYFLMEDSFAVPVRNGGQSYSGAEIKNNHYIVKGQRPPADALRVVQNSQTGEVAIFTGIVKVKLKDSVFVDEILNSFNCELEKSYEHIETYFFRFDSYDETLEANEELSRAAYVLRSEIDVIEYSRKAR